MSENTDALARPELVVDALLRHGALIAGGVLQISADTWAVHGSIPMDGEVILAEFDRPEMASTVLDQLAAAEAAVIAGLSRP
jgi:hypothetical protein